MTLSAWRSAELLHIGDHDPSGVHLFSSITPGQITALALPTAPAKATDRRSFEGETVQAEAIPPDTLAEIVRDAIEVRIDRATYDDVVAQEQAMRGMTRDEIIELIEEWPGEFPE